MTKGLVRNADARRGTSTVEVLVSIVLTTILVHLSWSVLVAARKTADRLIQRSEAIDAERLGWHVLSSELRAGIPARDWRVEGGKVIPLRAFRGLAEVCPSISAADGALVRYRGMRLPDPVKDSLLVLSASGRWLALELSSRSASLTTCPDWPGEPVERWGWEPELDGVLLARLFERGSYHIEDKAIRYRVGDAGRQPLTAERVESGSLLSLTASGVDLRLRVRVDERVIWDTTRRLAALESFR